jgi:hypothetical protein
MPTRITLVHKLRAWDAAVDPALTTWGDLKSHAAAETGVPEADLKLL